MSSRVSGAWRTWAFEAVTYADPQRLAAVRSGQTALRMLQRLVAGGSIKVRGGPGFGLCLSTDHLRLDHYQGYGLVRGVLEPSVQEALHRHVRPGDVVFDVGSNIGFFSLLAARFAGPAGRVESFEPVAAAAAAIRANAALNGLSTVSVHEVAVSDHSGVEAFLLDEEEGWSHLANRGGNLEGTTRRSVRLVSLDEEIDRDALPIPSVIKLDVEGSEIAALTGLRRTLLTHHPIVICELHETNVEIADLAEEVGYQLENLDGTLPVREAGPVHVLMRPRGPR